MSSFDPNSALKQALREANKRNQELVTSSDVMKTAREALRLYSERSNRELSEAVRAAAGRHQDVYGAATRQDIQQALRASSYAASSDSLRQMIQEVTRQRQDLLGSVSFNRLVQDAIRQLGQASPAVPDAGIEPSDAEQDVDTDADISSLSGWANWVARLSPAGRRLVLGALVATLAALLQAAATITDSDQLQSITDSLEIVTALIVLVSAINDAE